MFNKKILGLLYVEVLVFITFVHVSVLVPCVCMCVCVSPINVGLHRSDTLHVVVIHLLHTVLDYGRGERGFVELL
jgi:hypothetical protein